MTMVIWIALGTAMVLQAQFMGVMTERIGALESVFITYGLGGGLAAVAVLIARGSNLSEIRTVPWWALLAGVVGLVIV
jgi:transporter family-2 protein